MSYRVKLRVKELLEEEGITQKKLAEMAGVRESTISDIVRGTRTVINFEHLGKIATALEISDIRKIIDLEKVIKLIKGVFTTPFFCRHVIIIRTPHKEVKSIPNYGNYYICNRLLLLKEYLQANAEPKYSIKCRA